MPNAFVDTNVLVYAADEATPIDRKTRIAREVLHQRNLHLSVQVLNEFTVNARSKWKLNFSPQQEQEWLSRWLLFRVHPLTMDTFLEAQLIHARFEVSHWDALILAAAHETNSETVYSEDLTHGQDYDGVKVINPFL